MVIGRRLVTLRANVAEADGRLPVSLISELKRRNVVRVGAAYLAFGWIVTQVTTTVVPALNLPAVLVPIVVWVGVLGFPLVLLFSWVYELTPEGLKRESEIAPAQSITDHTARRLDRIVIVLLVVAIGLFLFDRVLPRSAPGVTGEAGAVSVNPSPEGNPAQGALPQGSTAALAGAAPGRDESGSGAAANLPDANSIAVLPFTNMSSDAEQEYFSDGLSEELLNLLAQVPELRVIARTSSFSFKGKDVDIATIARQLNVANLLEGSVRRSGNTLRITAQLVRASDSSHLWSKTFDREMTDVFKVQDEIATAVVEALKLKLLPARHASGSQTQTASTEAYNKYLLGQQYNNRDKPEAWFEAVRAFEEAIALDPSYAAAHAGLAQAEFYASDYRGAAEAIAAGKRRALVAAEKAIGLNPELADGYLWRAMGRSNLDWDWAGARTDLERALQLAPGDSAAQRRYALLLANIGDADNAMVAARKSVELDLLASAAWNVLSGAQLAGGDFAAARVSLQRALAINPESDFALLNLATIDLMEGRPGVALAGLAKASPLWALYGRALAEHSLGHADKAQAALDELETTQPDAAAYQIGAVYAWRGDKDKAFAWLERARLQNDGGLVSIKADPIFDGLREDPRYGELLTKIGLPL